ncbi:hypothetical protein GJAV_G00084780 [Gymnothorax javanicus]|nr:hypothetical protein GJAV_G00084780 [Gymnothorax javanicus]
MNSHAGVLPQKDFNLQKMAGKWYLVGFASNSEWFTTTKSQMKVLTVIMTPSSGGDLAVSHASLNPDGSCKRTAQVSKKTETPGRFIFYSQTWKNDNDMCIVDVKYDEYALVHTTKTQAGVSEILTNLYTRDAQPSRALVKKFQDLSKRAKILPENVLILPMNGKWPLVPSYTFLPSDVKFTLLPSWLQHSPRLL